MQTSNRKQIVTIFIFFTIFFSSCQLAFVKTNYIPQNLEIKDLKKPIEVSVLVKGKVCFHIFSQSEEDYAREKGKSLQCPSHMMSPYDYILLSCWDPKITVLSIQDHFIDGKY